MTEFLEETRETDYRNLSAIYQYYPTYDSDDAAEADDTLRKYVGLVWRILSRHRSENGKDLTKTPLNAKFKRPLI
ncbi:MAG: hypothetical protein IPM25_19855 [Chloracidobacterium sp.]|nr:hypothetical protein [Chloracidobacterium sp.]